VLRPTYEAIGAWLMAQSLLHADESGWLQIGETGKPKWTAWLICNLTAKLCKLDPSAYLREAITAARRTPGAITLPSQLRQRRLRTAPTGAELSPRLRGRARRYKGGASPAPRGVGR